MCEESSNQRDGRADAYEALIKRGDAVETPDGEVWVVEQVFGEALEVVSAHREQGDVIRVDLYHEATKTSLPRELVRKVADARQVRRQ